MQSNIAFNLKQIFIEALSLDEYIPIKTKIKLIAVSQTLPWMAFADIDNNVMIFDMNAKKPIRAFNTQYYCSEETKLKDIQFFNINDKKYISNYEINDIKKIKGIPFNCRQYLLILTFEKQIGFYSLMTQTIIKTIYYVEIENKTIVKVDVYNYIYLIILTADGIT